MNWVFRNQDMQRFSLKLNKYNFHRLKVLGCGGEVENLNCIYYTYLAL